jgi:hypothetical protein
VLVVLVSGSPARPLVGGRRNGGRRCVGGRRRDRSRSRGRRHGRGRRSRLRLRLGRRGRGGGRGRNGSRRRRRGRSGLRRSSRRPLLRTRRPSMRLALGRRRCFGAGRAFVRRGRPPRGDARRRAGCSRLPAIAVRVPDVARSRPHCGLGVARAQAIQRRSAVDQAGARRRRCLGRRLGAGGRRVAEELRQLVVALQRGAPEVARGERRGDQAKDPGGAEI